ncbi:tripartite tricarboxylate transporter substrate binding protein [Candidimonas humi]|nr:tripartite tricarboxylate transporter substrate binding protein [Candidimonas humi]
MHRLGHALPIILFSAASVLCAKDAAAKGYPDHPITVVVPDGAGGGMDLIGRVVSSEMANILHQSILVMDKPGASGSIGAVQVATQPPDGYTVLLGQTAQFAINPHLYAKLPYDPVKGFIPIVILAEAPNVITVGEKSPYHNVKGLLAAAAKANTHGHKLNFATPGTGTVSHLTGELLQHSAGVQLAHIPYKGAQAAITDTIAGRVDMLMTSVPTSLGQIKSGMLRAIAVTDAKRNPALPNVPTIGESGYPGFNAGTWYGLFVPSNTPQSIVQRLNAAANKALKSPHVIKTIHLEGGEVLGGTSSAFAALIRADSAKWGKVIKEAHIKVQ